ncbi:BON domain-containing protein [Roseateles cellulosilyticus]|uniref:BON domain-containing protein n=1 Tax=Pelomonas cellulosilytica TaxID=2906762 RepID=A0ABS8XZ55_9BURK|nr:BON domain-containing protein [Pelomonas sp. P8]MCE4557258.1 BON domain-containing protein [Pelomonas sp. P8]
MLNKPVLTLALASALVATLAATSGCAVTRNQETVGAYVDDAALTTRVKAKFAADPTVSAMSISVETLKGTVQLSGFAKNADEKAVAEKLARETSGVVAVRNDIAVRP